jgi:CRISPR-associated endonuclease/helicase Cas3
MATIVASSAAVADNAPGDPVYGHALRETWNWLNELGTVDFGVEPMSRAIDQVHPDRLRKLCVVLPDAPVMLPAHVDLFVQTSPRPAVDPDVSVFLHGRDRGEPDVQICWRADLDPENVRIWRDVVALCPPTSIECVAVPISVARRWLAAAEGEGEIADVESLAGADSADDSNSDRTRSDVRARIALRWRGPNDAWTSVIDGSQAAQLLPGEVLVLSATAAPPLGYIPPDVNVDRFEEAQWQARRIPVLRLHPLLLDRWTAARPAIEDMLADEECWTDAGAVLDVLSECEPVDRSQWVIEMVARFGRSARCLPYPDGRGIVLIGSRHPASTRASVALDFTDDDDSSSRADETPLESHCVAVERLAKRFAEEVGLAPDLVNAITTAGRYHDVGKADPRFQALLRGGSAVAAVLDGELWAKSRALPEDPEARSAAYRRSGYPHGGRHELLSVRLIESSGDPAIDDRVLHLVAAHHGRCRPFAPFVDDDSPVNVRAFLHGVQMSASSQSGLERIDCGVAERFWSSVRRYGWWGSVWLESMLRLADWCVSAEIVSQIRATERVS